MDGTNIAQQTGRRLSTWKEVAEFFGKDERTVRRWEASRGLPVRRVPGGPGTTIYAYTGELSRWLGHDAAGRHETFAIGESAAAHGEDPPPALPVAPIASAPRRFRRWPTAAAIVAASLLAGAGWVAFRTGPPAASAASEEAKPRNARAAELYLKGSYAWNLRTPESLTEALSDFNQTILLDPGFAPAYVGLANCYNLLREYSSMAPGEAYPRAEAAAERAVALDDRSPEAHRALAFDAFYWSRDIAKARREFKRSLELEPRSALTHHWYATFLSALGEAPEALKQIDIAQQLDPTSGPILADKAAVLMGAGRNADALDILQSMAALNPSLISPHAYLTALYFNSADDAGFVRELKATTLLTHDEGKAALAAAAARGLAASGRSGMLKEYAATQRLLFKEGREPAYELAKTYAAMHRPEEALAWLQTAVNNREPAVTAIHREPLLAALRQDARFKGLEIKAGFGSL